MSNLLRFFIVFLLFLSVTPSSFAQVTFLENGENSLLAKQGGAFSASPTRKTIDLAGTWEYSIDDKKSWSQVKIPGVYDGVNKIWFRRSFNVSSEMVENYTPTLSCFGINYFCEISINDNFIGRHIGGSTSFSFSLEKNVLQLGGNNTIMVYVDNELNAKNTVPLRQQIGGWKNYGGIFRDIFLLLTPKLSIDEVTLRGKISEGQGSATLTVKGLVSNKGFHSLPEQDGSTRRSESPLFVTELYDKTTNALVARSSLQFSIPEENHSAEISLSIGVPNVQLWSPETPTLYEVRSVVYSSQFESAVLLDGYTQNYGFREVEISKTQFLLNGSPFHIKGIAWIEDHPSYGTALTYEAMEKDIVLMKTAGVNLVRIANHPAHPYIFDLCDRYGLFVFEELPLSNVPTDILSNDNFKETAEAIAKEMVERDRNHSSVMAWGVGSDFESTESVAADVVHAIKSSMKNLDDRPVYYSSSQLKETSCLQETDFFAFNISSLEVQEAKKEIKNWLLENSNKPTIIINFGKEVEPGNRHGSSDPYSYEAQARSIQLLIDGMKEVKLAGIVIWSFNDYRGDRPAMSVHSGNPYLSTFGIVSEQREKRTSYDILKILNSGEKVFALPVGTYSFTAPMMYVVSGLLLLIIIAYFYNRNRRFRDNINRSLLRTFNFFADIRDHRIISIGETLLLTVIIAATNAIVLSSLLVHFRDSVFLDTLLSHLLISDRIKESIVYTVWSPTKAIVWFSVFFIVTYVIIAGVIKFFSIFIRTRVNYINAYEVTIWSMLPTLIFIPIGMILYRVLETPFYTYPVFILLALVQILILQRLLKGVSVIYDIFRVRVYFLGTLFIVIVLGATYSYYDYTQSTSAYLRYLIEIVQHK